jgi:DNA-binding cell septation regulator SpoVG
MRPSGQELTVKEIDEQAIRISQVEIIPFRPKAGHLGFASCVINNQFYLSDIAIFSRPQGGIRLAFPVKRLGNGVTVDIFKPLNQTVVSTIEAAVAEKYEKLMEINVANKECFYDGKKY